MRYGFSRFAGVVATILAVFCGPVAAQEELKDLARRAKESVVLLEVLSRNGRLLGTGTGFFIETDLLVTNHHVVSKASTVRAKFEDGRSIFIQEVVAEDSAADLALLRVGAGAAQPLTLYRGGEIEPGEEVVVLGNPEGLSGTLSTGIVSALRSDASDLAWSSIPLLQITAPISPGSSGSPVMNQRGEVLGVAVAVHRTGQNLNFAVPASEVRRLLSISGSQKTRALKEEAGGGSAWAVNAVISLIVFAGLALFIRRL